MRSGLGILRPLLLLAVLSGGGVGAAFYTGAVQIPDVSMADIGSWGDVTDEHAEIVTTIDVNNPNDFAIDLQPVGVRYKIFMNEVRMATGAKQGEELSPGNTSVDVTTEMHATNVADWWASHIQNDETTAVRAVGAVDLDAGVFAHSIDGVDYTHEVETELLPMLEQALSGMEGTYTYPATGLSIADPTIEIRDVSPAWGDITADHTELHVTLDVHNPNAYPLPTPEFVGELHMNDAPLASWEANDVDVVRSPANGLIAPQMTEEIVLSVSIDHEYVDDWLLAHIDRGEHTTGELKARMAFNVEGERFYVPQNGGLHCTFRFWTAILEDQEQRMDDDGCTFRNAGLFDGSTEGSGDDGTTDDSGGTDDGSDGSDGSSDDGDDGLIDGLP